MWNEKKIYIQFLYTHFYRELYTKPQVYYLYLNRGDSAFENSGFYKIGHNFYLLFFKCEPWLNLLHSKFITMFFGKLSGDVDRMRKIEEYIKEHGKYYRLTDLEMASYIKLYTVDYVNNARKIYSRFPDEIIEKIIIGGYHISKNEWDKYSGTVD